jgi:L-lactate utilization protein LutC
MSGELLRELKEAAVRVDATLEVAKAGELAGALRRYAAAQGATRIAFGAREGLAGLEPGSLSGGGVETVEFPEELATGEEAAAWKRELASCQIGVAGAAAAAAETSTLLVAPAREHERLVSLLPERHVAIVHAEDIVPTAVELMERFEELCGAEGSAVLVTGPSRTADIEKELVHGVHGPLAVHVIVVEEAGRSA